MQINISSLIGYHLEATDGEMGKVTAFYFDDVTWTIRYLVVETGNWLSGRKVLISPDAILKESGKTGLFSVNLTKSQVSNSPAIDTEKPVSQDQEVELFNHYPWPNYWEGGFSASGVWGILAPTSSTNITFETDTDHPLSSADSNTHLHSTKVVAGYDIHATDGDIGHVKDFIIEDQTWKVIFFVVDTHNFFPGKKVLLPVSNIQAVQWKDSKVVINITLEEVKQCRLFDIAEFTKW